MLTWQRARQNAKKTYGSHDILSSARKQLHFVKSDPTVKFMKTPLIDPFQRQIDYLRVSVTDRCDFRCVYCMSENMTFLPKKELLTLEELDRL